MLLVVQPTNDYIANCATSLFIVLNNSRGPSPHMTNGHSNRSSANWQPADPFRAAQVHGQAPMDDFMRKPTRLESLDHSAGKKKRRGTRPPEMDNY